MESIENQIERLEDAFKQNMEQKKQLQIENNKLKKTLASTISDLETNSYDLGVLSAEKSTLGSEYTALTGKKYSLGTLPPLFTINPYLVAANQTSTKTSLPSDMVHTHVVKPLLDELNVLQQNITKKEVLLVQSRQQLADNPPGSYPESGGQFHHFTVVLPQFINELRRDLVEMRANRENLKRKIRWLWK